MEEEGHAGAGVGFLWGRGGERGKDEEGFCVAVVREGGKGEGGEEGGFGGEDGGGGFFVGGEFVD